MDPKTPIRDAFFDKLYDLAKQDKNIILISADMGAPSLDKFRKDLSSQYINTGIAEQSAIAIAAGLAAEGKKPYVYAIMPFVTTRIHEFAKLNIGVMNLPITILGIGSGYSYDDSGPTHHTVEDISIMRAIPNIEILNPSDSSMSAAFAEKTAKSSIPSYVRLDRKTQELKYSETENFEQGFKELKSGATDGICLLATGNMVDIAVDILKQDQNDIGLIDVYTLKPINSQLISFISKYKTIITLEEHFLAGGFGSILAELICDQGLSIKLKRIGVKNIHNYEYGGRDYIQNKMGIGKQNIIDAINKVKNNQDSSLSNISF